MTDQPHDGSDVPASAPPSAAPGATSAGTNSRRTLLTALGTVAALLIGVGLGLLISGMLHSDDTAAEDSPAPDSVAVGFAQDMIRHHEQGVEMATIELENGTDPQVRSMAFDILTAQSNEIGQMQSWLTRWGYPLINPNPPMQWMGHGMAGGEMAGGMTTSQSQPPGEHADHDMPMPSASVPMPPGAMPSGSTPPGSTPPGSTPPGSTPPGSTPPGSTQEATADGQTPPMPGMATSSEMNRLRAARGSDADIYFLQLMLRHHEGGLPMMDTAADPAHVAEDYVRELATGMRTNQDREITVIEQMLAERDAQPLPMN